MNGTVCVSSFSRFESNAIPPPSHLIPSLIINAMIMPLLPPSLPGRVSDQVEWFEKIKNQEQIHGEQSSPPTPPSPSMHGGGVSHELKEEEETKESCEGQ